MMLKTPFQKINKLLCHFLGHLYPLKKLPTPQYLKDMFPRDYADPRVGAYEADTSKPCARCGKCEQ